MENNSIFGITIGMTFAYLGCLWNTRKAACNKLIRLVIYMWTIGLGIPSQQFLHSFNAFKRQIRPSSYLLRSSADVSCDIQETFVLPGLTSDKKLKRPACKAAMKVKRPASKAAMKSDKAAPNVSN